MEIKWPQLGNENIIEFLSRVVSKDEPSGAYLFLGPDDLGKSTIALAFARNLMAKIVAEDGNLSSDLHLIKAEEGKKMISIAQIRELIKTLSLSSFLNSYKIGIIKEAQTMTEEAQNALLKTLEEPRSKVILILLANSEEGLLPTIVSRVQKLHFQPVASEIIYDYLISEYGAKRSLAKDLANLSLGRPLKAAYFLENEAAYHKYQEKAKILQQFFTNNVNWRLNELPLIFNDKTYSVQAVKGAEGVIEILEGLSRDLLLLYFNQPEKIQHAFLREDLQTSLEQLKVDQENQTPLYLLKCFRLMAQARSYLDANVNPYVVLEQLAINF